MSYTKRDKGWYDIRESGGRQGGFLCQTGIGLTLLFVCLFDSQKEQNKNKKTEPVCH